MQILKILVTCQYKENYSDTDTPHWKNKGAYTFTFDIEEGDWLYDSENAKKWMNELIEAKHNNSMCRCEPVEWEIFREPEHVGTFESNAYQLEILEKDKNK